MKIKVAEATDQALNWMVAQCKPFGDGPYCHEEGWLHHFYPSTQWAHGGPIIEQKTIDIGYTEDGWYANMFDRAKDATAGYTKDTFRCGEDGPTPLIAAMRCYVVSELGNEVEVPDELL